MVIRRLMSKNAMMHQLVCYCDHKFSPSWLKGGYCLASRSVTSRFGKQPSLEVQIPLTGILIELDIFAGCFTQSKAFTLALNTSIMCMYSYTGARESACVHPVLIAKSAIPRPLSMVFHCIYVLRAAAQTQNTVVEIMGFGFKTHP